MALLLLLLFLFLWTQKGARGGKTFALLMLASSIWSFSVGVESTVLSLEDKVLWSKISYLGIICVAPLWLLFVLKFTHIKQSFISRINSFLWFIPIIQLILVFTDFKDLIWTTVEPVSDNIRDGVFYNHGLFFFIFTIYSYIGLLFGLFLLVRFIIRSKEYRKHSIIFVLALIFPFLANVIYNFLGITLYNSVELTPFALSITGIVMVWGIFRVRVLLLIPSAKDYIFTKMKNPVIILNSKKDILSFNDSAKKLIGSSLKIASNIDSLEKPFSSNLFNIKDEGDYIRDDKNDRWLDLQILNIDNEGESNDGFALIFYDISKIKKQEQSLKDSEHFLSSVIEFLPDATLVLNEKHEVIVWNKAIEELTNVSAEDMLGKSGQEYAIPFYHEKRPILADLVLDSSSDKLIEKYYDVFQKIDDGYVAEVYLEFMQKHVWAIAKPLYNKEGKIIGSIEAIRDITKRKDIEKTLKKKVDELTRTNKLMLDRELKMIELKNELKKNLS